MSGRDLISRGWAIAFSLAALAASASAQSPTGAGPDAERDRRFEDFVRRTAGSMVGDVAVETEHHMKVRVRESVPPEQVLPLTKSLIEGARRDFPDQLITAAVYDPAGKPILRARFRPGHGVDYEVVHTQGREGHDFGRRDGTAAPRRPDLGLPGPSPSPTAPSSLPQAGRTDRDAKFAEWAERKGHDYLRYVEADLENHGRLWFGVTRAVKPDDVKDLTKSLLEGARNEFPRRELTATVFDPDGEKIGTASLGADGQVRWSH